MYILSSLPLDITSFIVVISNFFLTALNVSALRFEGWCLSLVFWKLIYDCIRSPLCDFENFAVVSC